MLSFARLKDLVLQFILKTQNSKTKPRPKLKNQPKKPAIYLEKKDGLYVQKVIISRLL